MCIALSKYKTLVLFLILFYEMEEVYKECAIILEIYLCFSIPYVFRSDFSLNNRSKNFMGMYNMYITISWCAHIFKNTNW